jgi:two-component system sensor histidine kinase SenX3
MPAALIVAPAELVALLVAGFALGTWCGWHLARRPVATGRLPDVGTPAVAAPSAETGIQGPDPRIEGALGALPLGVVVTDVNGQVIYRNRFAQQFERARHGAALVQAAVDEMLAGALSGQLMQQPVDLYGPPARDLLLRGLPAYEHTGGGHDQLSGAVVLIEDVTAAHQVDRVRKDFVANVSHELRTPVGAIGVLAETLRDAEDPEVVDRLANRLQHEAFRLGDVIDDLLALSRLESGQIEDPELMELHQVVKLAVERMAPAIERREMSVEVAEAGAAVFVEGDQAQMVSAVANLLDNAVKYSDDGAEVAVTVDQTADEAVLTVTDHGVGIPASAHERIFERFYRVDDARSRATGGTGLGLSIVRHVVINHRGRISVTSAEGEGSSFTIRLPLAGGGR